MRSPLPVPSISRRAKILIGAVVLFVLLFAVLSSVIRLYVDWLWFGEVGYRRVFSTALRTRAFLFLLFGLLMTAIVAANLVLAYRLRPPFRPMSQEQQNLERYRGAVEPRRRLITVVVSAVLGLFVGITAQTRWETWLLWRNGTRFNVRDPQFGRDIAYYAFTYPFQRFILGYLFAAVLLAFLVALVVHYLFGGVRLQTPGEKVTPAARVHLSVLLGLFVLLKAAGYYLDRYGLLFNERDQRTGASYTDVNAVLPAKNILIWVALVSAAMFFANIVLRNVQLPAFALVLLVFVSVAFSGIYPALVQQFSVRPNANEKEAPFIRRNIEATRAAYGIPSAAADAAPGSAAGTAPGGNANGTVGAGVQYAPYDAKTTATAAQLRDDQGTIANARLLDPTVLSPTFTQFQQIRNVYGFPTKLDIDRYTVDGKKQDYLVAVRELKSAALSGTQQNWINRHTVYTHGNGFVAVAANRSLNSQDDFTVGGLPQTGPIPVQQPDIYYGELISDYSIVKTNGPAREFERPGGGSDSDITSTYGGSGGVSLGNLVNRLAFTAYYRERNFLLSSAIGGQSRVMFVRDPAERVQKVAPFLKVDADPYPAVVDGRIVWLVDGYTTLDGYPYSERQTLGEVTTDSLTGQEGGRRQPDQQINYIRNSVKATVDAYDGTVRLYQFDGTDPVLQTWMKAYPGVIRPQGEISDALRAHFRYPEDLFKVQRLLLTRYHVDDPQAFYASRDFWRVPDDPTENSSAAQPPYYIVAQVPGQQQPTFQLTSALNALQRENLAAYVSVSSDPSNYGRIQVLTLPGSTAILGPGQVQGRFNSTPEIASARTLLDQNGSQVKFGNLLTLPVGGGLLYIEPLYVQGAGVSYPVLQKVIAAFGDKVAFQNTLPEALNVLFGPGAGAVVPGGGGGTSPSNPSTTPSSPTATPSQPAPGGPTGAGSSALDSAVRGLNAAVTELEAAYKSGDFVRIGRAQATLRSALGAYERARGPATPSGTPSTPRPGPSG